MDTNENGNPADRPLGFWLRAVDGLITRGFAEALAADDLDRRDWMILNAIAGTADVPQRVRDALTRGGKRMRALVARGWVEEREGDLVLTDDGRDTFDRLAEKVAGIRARVSGAVSPDDYATMTASLEAIARELGWDEETRMPRHRGRGFGRRFAGRGSGPGFGPGFQPHQHHGHHPCHHRCGEPADHHGEEPFERGFEAGFAAARRADA